MSVLMTLLWLMVAPAIAKIIDLSHVHTKDTFMSPNNPHYERNVTFAGDYLPGIFVEHGEYFSGEHGGTHMDAPRHGDKNGKVLDEIPIEYTILDGVMIDCSNDVNGRNSYVMPLQKLHDWEKEHGQIPQGAAIVINFGWSSRIGDAMQYVNSLQLSDIRTFAYPVISKEAGDWLVKERDARLLAVDDLSPDRFEERFPVHMAFLLDDRLIVENVRDPGRLPPRGFRLHAAPVKYKGASGAQIRLYAMTYDSTDNGTGNLRPFGTFCHTAVLVSFALVMFKIGLL